MSFLQEMPSTINEYKRLETIKEAGKLSRRLWFAFLLLCAFWSLLIIAAPVASASGVGSISEPLYSFFGHICHQNPARSFFLMEQKFGVCSRWTGVYFGLVLGFLIYPIFRQISETEPLPRIWLFLAMVPIGIDWALTFFGYWENTYFTRVTTGLILGIACAVFIIPALSEIALFIRHRRHRSPDAIHGR